MFEQMLDSLKREVVRILSHVEIRRQDEIDQLEQQRREEEARKTMQFQHADASALPVDDPAAAESALATAPFVRDEPKIGRNELCHCGSGKKFKHCHGKLA